MGDADIIHPRSQGTGAETEFVEPWVKRERPKIKRREHTGGHPPARWRTDAKFAAELRELLTQGVRIKDIAERLDTRPGTIVHYKKSMGFKPKFRRGTTSRDEAFKLTFNLSEAFYKTIKRHCGRRITMSAWIRAACEEKMMRESV